MCWRCARKTAGSGTPWYAGIRMPDAPAAANAVSTGRSPRTRSVSDSLVSRGIACLLDGPGLRRRLAPAQLPVQAGERLGEPRARVRVLDLADACRAEARPQLGGGRHVRKSVDHLVDVVEPDEEPIVP